MVCARRRQGSRFPPEHSRRRRGEIHNGILAACERGHPGSRIRSSWSADAVASAVGQPDSHGEPLMTATVVPAGVAPPRPAWRSLLWIAPLTLLWTLLTYWQPIITASGVQTTAHQLMAHGLIALGLWLGLERTNLTPGQRRTTWLAVM